MDKLVGGRKLISIVAGMVCITVLEITGNGSGAATDVIKSFVILHQGVQGTSDVVKSWKNGTKRPRTRRK